MRRELLLLLVMVLVVHALFLAGHFLFHIAAAGPTVRLGYTAAWTVVTLVAVLRALTRIRRLRGRTRPPR